MHVETADGTRLRFVVETIEQPLKDQLPADLYTAHDRPRMNLVTCDATSEFGGDTPGHYDRNLLVRTVLAE